MDGLKASTVGPDQCIGRAFVVTVSLLPFEIYELANKLSPFKIVAFVINVAVAVYLLFAKRLFGFNGGRAKEDALMERDVGWQALDRTTPAAEPS